MSLPWLLLSIIPVSMTMTDKDLTIISREFKLKNSPKRWHIYVKKFLEQFIVRSQIHIRPRDRFQIVYLRYLLKATALLFKISKRENIRVTSDTEDFWGDVTHYLTGYDEYIKVSIFTADPSLSGSLIRCTLLILYSIVISKSLRCLQ